MLKSNGSSSIFQICQSNSKVYCLMIPSVPRPHPQPTFSNFNFPSYGHPQGQTYLKQILLFLIRCPQPDLGCSHHPHCFAQRTQPAVEEKIFHSLPMKLQSSSVSSSCALQNPEPLRPQRSTTPVMNQSSKVKLSEKEKSGSKS